VLDESSYESVVSLEPFLHQIMLNELDKGYYDFLHSGLGIFYTFISVDNLKKFNKQEIIKSVVDKIEKISIPEKYNQIRWADVDFVKNILNPGRVNLGLAHGIPSILSILAKSQYYCEDVNTIEKITNMVERAGSYIYSIESEGKNMSALYPYGFDLDKEPQYPERLSWCYGDFGVALSYWHMYKMGKNDVWKERALAIVDHAAKRHIVQENTILDAGFCHGASGLAHLFRKFFWLTGDELYIDISDYWIRKTLQFGIVKESLTGYKYYHGTKGYIENYGLLEGMIGTGTVLISSLSEQEYDWDKIWLVS
jgi:lantibiotic biosynthesis protein